MDLVLKSIRDDPAQTMRYCSNLVVGSNYFKQGMKVEFLDTLSTPNFDMIIDEKFALEVKLLEDNSKWTELSLKVLEIPSNYLVRIETDKEISGPQMENIVEFISKGVSEHSEQSFSLAHPSANLYFIQASKSGRTLPIVGMRSPDTIDVPEFRRLFLTRISDASRQLRSSNLIKVATIDVNNPWVHGDVLDDTFCGTEQEHFTKETFQYLGSSRLRDGVLHNANVFDVVDAILIFFNNAHVAQFWKPSTPHANALGILGTPHTCIPSS
jgi:hypothetical protein